MSCCGGKSGGRSRGRSRRINRKKKVKAMVKKETAVELIIRTFKELDEFTGGEFVTLRNFDMIPELSSLKNDIDILCHKDIRPLMTKLGYKHHADKGYKYVYNAKPHIHFSRNSESGHGVHFDLVEGLFYKSLLEKNCFVRVHEDLQKWIIERRVKSDKCWIYQPSIVDQAVHLCCHAIFDKGVISNRYVQKIQTLFLEAESTSYDYQTNESRLLETLDRAFFKFAPKLVQLVKNGQAESLYTEYKNFSEY